MKKVLLSTAAIAGLALAATSPAQAESALQLGVGGYIQGYAVYTDQEDTATAAAGDELRKFDFRKDTEVHLTGEVALDNGITAGAHMELLMDRADGNQTVEESYMYLSSSWGRVNFGEEDGAAYLLQVATPSADASVDGIRPDIGTFTAANGGTLDYAHDDTAYSNKLTYITPVFNGFQAAASYTPSVDAGLVTINGITAINGDGADAGIVGAGFDDSANQYDNVWELAARYEGSFDAIDLALGAGYSHAGAEFDNANGQGVVASDDLETWNVGANIGWGQFGLGVAYITSNNGINSGAGNPGADTDTIVAGVDYVTGPYKLGLSYLNSETEAGAFGAGTVDQETDRWTAGAIYEWGPGMTFRGAIQWQDVDNVNGSAAAGADGDGTQVTLGTQLNF